MQDFADSVRNRPVRLKSDEPAEPFEAGAGEMLRQFLEQGMSPLETRSNPELGLPQ